MDSEHRDLMIKTRALIETTRREISQLREEIESGRNTVGRSQRLLFAYRTVHQSHSKAGKGSMN